MPQEGIRRQQLCSLKTAAVVELRLAAYVRRPSVVWINARLYNRDITVHRRTSICFSRLIAGRVRRTRKLQFFSRFLIEDEVVARVGQA
jgi:cytidylate kinase